MHEASVLDNFAYQKSQTMKVTTLIIILTTLLSFPLYCYGGKDDNKGSVKLLVRRGERPSLPSYSYVEVYYGDSEIIFDFPEHIIYMTVELRQRDAVVLTGMVDHEDASLDVAGLHGEYEILCRTDGNQLFAGNIEL